ncbi:MAG: magnesium transporter CorA family protein [Oligoflexia bacterium]|nr:magnesium transporter CorA family protein [Oligoflexia bacterium]
MGTNINENHSTRPCVIWIISKNINENIEMIYPQNADEMRMVLEKYKNENDKIIWINLTDPTALDFEPLAKTFALHDLTVEDCTNEDQLPKIDFFPNYTFFILNFFENKNAKVIKPGKFNMLVQVSEVDFILSHNYLITAHKSHTLKNEQNSLVDYNRLKSTLKSEMLNSADYLAYQIIDQINERKFMVIEKIQEEINNEEDLIIRGGRGIGPQRLIYTRRKIVLIRKSIFHERELLYKICRKDSPFIREQMIYYYHNLYDQLFKFFEFSEILREEISSLLELHLSIKNNHLAELSNQTNQAVKRLTMFTTIFMPLTLIAGIGGMSEWSMMTGPNNWRFSYPLLILLLIGIGYLNYLWFKKRKW